MQDDLVHGTHERLDTMAPQRLSPLDISLMEALRQFGWMSGPQLSLFTGAHGSTVKKRLYRLRGAEFVDRSTVTTYANLRGVHRLADMDLVSVWHLTRTGLRHLGPIEDLPGSGARLGRSL
ncbi:MAG: hypothetical protein NVV66_16445 [Cellulomonas sp.]|uniref:hypothetical protein n=1 Tax=Cellulomonas sp. TaxID=40001 RepID=UPI00258E26FF|nr:hypothetical protein [Cellulomonas sp.]MCR6706205.1 hypothetical protein [Cellulomonas sp.]